MNHSICWRLSILLLPSFIAIGHAENLKLSDLDGMWAASDYIQRVQKTRDHFETNPETLTLTTSSGGVTTAHIINHHEVALFELSHPQRVEQDQYRIRVVETGAPATPQQVTVTTRKNHVGAIEELRFSDKPLVFCSTGTYIRIPKPLREMVNQWVLAGEYADKKGNTYRFGTDGVAHWPGRQFRYDFSLDGFGSACPGIIVDSKSFESYGIQWKKQKLFIYPTRLGKEDGAIYCEPKPLAVLTPQSAS